MNVIPDLLHENRALGGRALDEQRWTVVALLDVARRRGKLIAASLVACVALALVYVAISPSRYTSTAVLVTDTRQTPPSPGQVSAEPLIDPAVTESQIEILKSDRIALDVVDRLKLMDDPEIGGGGPSWTARLIAGLTHKPITPPSPESRHLAAVDSLLHKLKITRTGHSYLAEIAATTLDPVKSAQIANAVADAYIQDQLDGRMQANQRSSVWMKQRVDEVRAEADQAEKTAQDFRNQHAAELKAAAAAPPPADRADLSAALSKAQLARALYQSRIDKLTQLAAAGPPQPVSAARLNDLAAIDDPDLNGLVDLLRRSLAAASGQPGAAQPAQPDVQKSIDDRLAQLLAEGRGQAHAAEATIVGLTKRIADADAIGTAGDELDRRLKALDATARTDRDNYESLLNRYNRLSQFLQQQSLPVTEARILTEAQPPLSKSSPKTTVILLLSIVGGLTLGCGAALVRESLDRRIRWPHQITRSLALPFAGALPVVRRTPVGAEADEDMSVSRLEAALLGRRKSRLAVLFDSRRPWCSATETLRTIKIAIDQGVRRSHGAVIGIVSPWPGDGKSTIAHNLAQLMGETGARVLLIDADFRKPDLSHALVPQNAYGFVDMVEGTAGIEHCAAATELGFDLLGCAGDPAPLHPFDILGSSRMQGAIVTAQQNYDYVILDLPALLVSVDAQAVARFVDAFVLVAKFGRTTTDDIEHGLATSEFIADRIVATVLNKSPVAKSGGYRASHGRRLLRGAAA